MGQKRGVLTATTNHPKKTLAVITVAILVILTITSIWKLGGRSGSSSTSGSNRDRWASGDAAVGSGAAAAPQQQQQQQCGPGRAGPSCAFSLATVFADAAPTVYEGAPSRPPDLAGFNVNPALLNRLLAQVTPSLIVEVGVFKGASSTIFGRYLKARRGGALLAVDPFYWSFDDWLRQARNRRLAACAKAGRPGAEDCPEADRVPAATTSGLKGPGRENYVTPLDRGFPTTFYVFTSNVARAGLRDYVIPIPARSESAARLAAAHRLRPGFVYVDGAHGQADVARDVRAWWPLLAPGGVMVGDDYNARAWPGVVRAVDEFARVTGVQVHKEANKWWLHKPVDDKAAQQQQQQQQSKEDQQGKEEQEQEQQEEDKEEEDGGDGGRRG